MRNPPKVEPGDLAALSAWVVETRAAVDDLYFMTLDATAKKSERKHARIYLRAQARRRYQKLGALLAAVDPADVTLPGPATMGDGTP
jgi:hypothetical protein